jgi:hypothetical protein
MIVNEVINIDKIKSLVKKGTLAVLLLILLLAFFQVIPNVGAIGSRLEAGCIIRPDATGNWYILNNAYHEPKGCNGISQNSTSISVTFSPSFAQVVTGFATPDEGLLGGGLHSGLSLGLNVFVVYLFDANGNIIDPSSVTIGGSNVWLWAWGID